MGVNVTTPVYEGPFDLLLDLILREEVELYEVSLLTIVDAYLEELENMQEYDLELATEFLLIASDNAYKIHEIPVKWTDDPDTRVKIISTALEDIKGLLRLRFGGLSRARKALVQR